MQGIAAAFPPLFASLINLQLEGNLLEQEELEEMLNRLPNLATLSLAATGLVSFPAELVVNNKQLTHLNLRCDFRTTQNLEFSLSSFPYQLKLLGPPGPRGVLLPSLTETPRPCTQLPYVSSPAILPGDHKREFCVLNFCTSYLTQHLSLQAVTNAPSLQLVYLQVNTEQSHLLLETRPNPDVIPFSPRAILGPVTLAI